MDVTCVSGGARGCFIVCAVMVERELPFLLPPHLGRGPAQLAERVWPRRGSETDGEEFVGFAERGVLVFRSERKRNWRERVQCVANSRGFEACSGWHRSERAEGYTSYSNLTS